MRYTEIYRKKLTAQSSEFARKIPLPPPPSPRISDGQSLKGAYSHFLVEKPP